MPSYQLIGSVPKLGFGAGKSLAVWRTIMKSRVNFFVLLVFVVGIPVYAANFTVEANLHSLDLVVEKSTDGQAHIIKNFDIEHFKYGENINGNMIRLISAEQMGTNTDPATGRITYIGSSGTTVVRDERARVVVQVPDGVTIKYTSLNGGVTVNNLECASIDIETINGDFTFNRSRCDSIELTMNNGNIYYTGTIDGVNIDLETGNGDIRVALERGSDVDVDIQSRYSYTYHPLTVVSPGVTMSGTEKTGYSTGRISNKNGNGTINAVSRTGNIGCEIL
jgi:hypothetical protein